MVITVVKFGVVQVLKKEEIRFLHSIKKLYEIRRFYKWAVKKKL